MFGNMYLQTGIASLGKRRENINYYADKYRVYIVDNRIHTDKGTYLSVPTQITFKSILTDRELDAYLKYEYLSCPHSGLENR
jgi:hypothetical protein